jgi:uncharacterized lipoprotein YmbA
MRYPSLAVLLAVAACGSPPSLIFDLSPAQPGPLPQTTRPVPAGRLIYVDRPAVAGYFDRTQMVTRDAGNRVSIHEFEIWSDPPAELIGRAVVDDLAHRFGADRVMTTPIARYAVPDWRVQVDVLRFDVDDRGTAVVDARWTLLREPDESLAATRRERIETQAGDVNDPARRVAALREAVSILSSRIADAIANQPPAAPARVRPLR